MSTGYPVMSYNLVLRGGRVIDPSQKLDAVTDIAFSAGKVARIGPELKGNADTDIRDVSGAIVAPGLIDLHTPRLLGRHVAWHRRGGFLPPLGRHHRRRHRQCGAGQLRRIPQARHRAQPSPHPCLSARLFCRDLRLLAACDGGRERGNPADGTDRCC